MLNFKFTNFQVSNFQAIVSSILQNFKYLITYYFILYRIIYVYMCMYIVKNFQIFHFQASMLNKKIHRSRINHARDRIPWCIV